MSESEEESISI